MKLWPTTTENKCFVKMVWHLLSECVKIKVLLVCSSGTVVIVFFFFFSLPFVLFFKLCRYSTCALFIQCTHCSSTVEIWWGTIFFFFCLPFVLFFKLCRYSACALFIQRIPLFIYSGNLVRHLFIYFFLPFVLFFFFYIYCYIDTTKFHNIFTIIEVSISYKSK